MTITLLFALGTVLKYVHVAQNVLMFFKKKICNQFSIGDAAFTSDKLSHNDIVIIMSHRATKQYSAQALQIVKESKQKPLSILVTGISKDVAQSCADYILFTSEKETSSAFTYSHTAAITVLLGLAVQVGVLKKYENAIALSKQLLQLPTLVSEALKLETQIKQYLATILKGNNLQDFKYYCIGNGVNTATALEVALKLKETCYVNCEGFQLEQFLHGPFCSVNDRTVCIFLFPPKNGANNEAKRFERTVQVMNACNTVKAKVLAITMTPLAEEIAHVEKLAIPVADESVSSILYLIPLQLITYWLTVEYNKSNPDSFKLDYPLFAEAKKLFQL